ncbi:MAG: exosortase-associated EpsI family protein [Planctomycetota bacterium]
MRRLPDDNRGYRFRGLPVEFTPASSRFSFRTGVFSAALVLAALPVLPHLARQYLETPEYSFGPVLLAVVAWHLWRERAYYAAGGEPSPAAGAIVFAGGVLLYAVGALTRFLFVWEAGILVLAAGGMVFMKGWGTARRWAFPFLASLAAVPVPYLVVAEASFRLRMVSVRLTEGVLALFLPDVVREGTCLVVNGIPVEVAEACSGLRCLLSTAAIVAGLWLLVGMDRRRKWLLVVLVAPLAVLGNTLRLVANGFLCLGDFGPGVRESLHQVTGIIPSVVAVAGILLALRSSRQGIVRRRFRAVEAGGVVPAWSHALAGIVCLLPFLAAVPGGRRLAIPALVTGDCAAPPFVVASDREAVPDGPSARTRRVEYRSPEGHSLHALIRFVPSVGNDEGLHSPRHCLPGGGWIREKTRGIRGETIVVYQRGDRRMAVGYFYVLPAGVFRREAGLPLAVLWSRFVRGEAGGALVRVTADCGDDEPGVCARVAQLLEGLAGRAAAGPAAISSASFGEASR